MAWTLYTINNLIMKFQGTMKKREAFQELKGLSSQWSDWKRKSQGC